MIYTVLIFQGGNMNTKLRYDDKRNIEICNEITDNEWLPLSEKLFNDHEKRNRLKIMLSKIPKLTQDEFDVYLVLEFGKMGYQLTSKYNASYE